MTGRGKGSVSSWSCAGPVLSTATEAMLTPDQEEVAKSMLTDDGYPRTVVKSMQSLLRCG